MDLEQASDDLYGAAPEEFVARRSALVAEARAARDRDLAKAIGALRKPSKTAWLVNLLAREAADDVAELLAIAEALRTAQAGRAGADVRRLSVERRRVTDGLVRRAGELAAERGRPANDATLQEVALTLQTALADAETAGLVRAGRLTGAIAVGGFGGWDLGADASPGARAAAAESRGRTAGSAEVDASIEDPTAREARLADEARAAEAARLAAETATAEQDLADAQAAAEGAAERVETLRDELSAAESAAAEAASRLDAALRRLIELGAAPQ